MATASDPGEAAARAELRRQCQTSTYFLAKAVLGFPDLTLRTHGPMCDWIDTNPRRALALAPRSTFKSTILTLAKAVQRVTVNPDVRILLVSGSLENAQKMLRLIQEVFEKNRLFQALFPELIPNFSTTKRWNSSEMLVPRTASWPESTIEAIGTTGMVTSRHYDVIHNDDLIGEQQADSPTEIQKAISFYQSEESLLVNVGEGIIQTVGTRWAFHDPYGWMLEHEAGLETYIKSAEDRWPDGSVYFPERLPEHELARLKAKQGTYRFSCLYLNKPQDPEAGGFQKSWLRRHTVEGEWIKPDNGPPVSWKACRRWLRVDPAISERVTAARTALVVDGMADDETIYLLEVWAERCQPLAMFEAIFLLCDRWDLDTVYVEAVAYQKTIKPFFEAECARRGRHIRVEDLKPDTRKSKEARIRACQPYLERRQVSVDPVAHAAFVAEYVEFPFGGTVDILDAWGYGPFVWELPLETSEDEAEAEAAQWEATRAGQSVVTGY